MCRNVGADCPHGLVEFLLATARDKDICPSSANNFVVANPIPSVPPVMRAILIFKLVGHLFLRRTAQCADQPALGNWMNMRPFGRIRSFYDSI